MVVTLTFFVLAWAFPSFPGDQQALLKVQDLQTPWLIEGARGVAYFGWPPGYP